MRDKELINDYSKVTDALYDFYDKHCIKETIFDVFRKYYKGPQQWSEGERKISELNLKIANIRLELIRDGEIKCCVHDLLQTIEDYISILDIDGYINCKYYLIKTLLGENEKESV